MSYENPQTVIDTQSAKIYAQAISNIGLLGAKVINAETERKRNEVLENKKRNLQDSKSRTKYNAEYLTSINKGLKNAKGFDLKPRLRGVLNDKVNEAVELKIQLDNFTGDPNKRIQLQNELNAIETLFDVGLEEGLMNMAERRNSISELGVNGGKEDGLSYSHNNSYMIGDVSATFDGQEDRDYDIGISLVDGNYNIIMDFTGENNRSYNLNKDFANDSLVINPNISSNVSKTMQDLQYVGKGGGINMKGPITAIFKKDTTSKTIEGIKYNFAEVDQELLYNKMEDSITATISGIVKQGREADGDFAYGLLAMQSYVDDVLPDNIDADIGELLPDPTTESGIDQNQFEMIAQYIVSQKTADLNAKMPPISKEELNIDIDDRTADEKNEARRKANLSKEINLLGKKLEEKVIPTFTSLDDPNVNKLITYIENLDGIKSVDFSKDLAKGDKSSFKVVGKNKSVTIDTGMSQAQIKKAILKAAGANDKQVDVFDFTKTDDKMVVSRDIVDVPNEFDIFKRK